MSLPYLLFSVSGMSREEESAGAPDQTWPALHEGGTSAHSLIAPSSSQGNRFLGNVSKAGSIQTSDTGTNTPRLATGRMVPTCNECNEAIEGTPYDATKQIIFRNRVKMSPINICGDCKEEHKCDMCGHMHGELHLGNSVKRDRSARIFSMLRGLPV